MNRKGTAIWLSVIFIFIIVIIVIALSPKASAYTPHDPIEIRDDLDFANQAESEGWPGNGSEGNPYIIEGYEITLEGGHNEDYYGIYITQTDVNFEIKDLKINGYLFSYGIFLNNVRNGNITGCILENNSEGIYLFGSHEILVKNNTLINNSIRISESFGCTFIENKFVNGGFQIGGMFLDLWNTHIINTSNTIYDKPVYYLNNQHGGVVPEDAGQVILTNCTNILIENLELSNGSMGIILGYSSNNSINGNIINNCILSGIHLWYSSENTIVNNNISGCQEGLYLFHSDNNSIEGNELLSNSWGIELLHSNNNYVYRNNASNGGYGIYCGSPTGHFTTQGNSIVNNTIFNNRFFGIQTENIIRLNVVGNNISNNPIGISLSFTNLSIFHHNTLINNSIQLEREDSENVWQDGKSQGNFWDDYEGLDANGDGIGDMSLPHLNVDYYPLMEPGGPGDYGEPDPNNEKSTGSDTWLWTMIIILFFLIVIIFVLLIAKKRRRKTPNGQDMTKQDEQE